MRQTMDAIQALKTRRCVRAYSREPVPKQVIEELIDCARLAPTALNVQPWEFVVATAPEMIRKIAETTDHGRFIAEAPTCVVVLCKNTKYYLEDGSAATQNILLAARAHGLGACWVAGDKKPYADRILSLIGAAEGYRLISLIPIGYPAEEPQQQKRPLSELLHWERF
jgi:nitroreductase